MYYLSGTVGGFGNAKMNTYNWGPLGVVMGYSKGVSDRIYKDQVGAWERIVKGLVNGYVREV